jgi:acylphosphatase
MGDAVRQVIIRGRVQGVGFRYWTRRTATVRGLEGWVRNRRDGSVEAVFAGGENAVDDMIELCRRGPDAAWVEGVEENSAGPEALNLRKRGEPFSELPTV